MSSVTIAPDTFEVLGDSSEIKFSTDNRYPIVMAEKTVTPYLYADIPVQQYTDPQGGTGYSSQASYSFEYVYLQKGVDYEETPDFVIGVLDAETTSTSYTATITGSYPIHFILTSLGTSNSPEDFPDPIGGIGISMMAHLFIDGNGDVRYRGEILAANIRTTGNVNNPFYLATERLKAETQYLYTFTFNYVPWHMRRFRFDASPLKIYVGKFIG